MVRGEGVLLMVFGLVHVCTVVACGRVLKMWSGMMVIIRMDRVRLGMRRGGGRQWRGQGDGIRRKRTVL